MISVMVEGYDRCMMPRVARVQVPMRDICQYANSASMSFTKVLIPSGTTAKPTKLQIHLAITN